MNNDLLPTSVVENLREIDAQLSQLPRPLHLEHRLLNQVDRPPGRRGWHPGWALGAAVAGFGLALGIAPPEPPPPLPSTNPVTIAAQTPPPATNPAPPFTVLEPGCAPEIDGTYLSLPAGCRVELQEPRLTMESWAPSRLELKEYGPQLEHGQVLFAVQPVAPGDHRVEVGVAGGTIEVLGTRFAVRQDTPQSGYVDLLEGKIQFRNLEGEISNVVPGERYRFGIDAAPTPTVARKRHNRHVDPKPATSKKAPAPAGPDLEALLQQANRLRRGGNYRGAAKLLNDVQRKHGAQLDRRALEVLSYEVANLAGKYMDLNQQCELWIEHQKNFPKGRYRAVVARTLKGLSCPRADIDANDR